MYTVQDYTSRNIKQHRYNLRKRIFRFPNIQKQVKRSYKQSEKSTDIIQSLQKLSPEFKRFLLEDVKEYVKGDVETTEYDNEISEFFGFDDSDKDSFDKYRDLFLLEILGLLRIYKV